MGKIKILGTGLTGMAGSRIVDLLSSKYDFENISLQEGTDITNKKSVFSKIASSKAEVILHLAAITNVDFCEKEKNLKEKSKCWQANVNGTENVADACLKFNKKLIYISTDFVFDGSKEGAYTEEDIPNPVNFYGQTKLMGEKIVQKLLKRFLICRVSFLYGGRHKTKQDFVQKIAQRFKSKQEVLAVSDQIFTPTFIDDAAFVIDELIERNQNGIFHVVGNTSFSPYEASIEIAKIFDYDADLVKKIYFKDFYKNRAPRPKKLVTKNTKLTNLGIKMKSFSDGLKTLL